ncbi:MAG: hypothetical protein D6695_01755 [Planctomycetota bacterium]|nr:MAG: hypothetical protein D6695_01755 [Planctomycetota bacterium]
MSATRKIEVFTAGCPVCEESVELVHRIACSSCEVRVLDMHDPQVAERARSIGIGRVPAVAVGGTLVECCAGAGPNEAALRAAGVGQIIA